MDYEARITCTKVLTKVLVHLEVSRKRPDGWPVIVYQWTDTVEEEAHPEPQKWLIQHVMAAFEQMP